MRPKRSVVITMNIVAFVVVLLILSPLLMLVLNSFRETMDIYQNPLKLPRSYIPEITQRSSRTPVFAGTLRTA